MGSKHLFGRRKVMAGAAATAGLTIWSQRLSAQSGEVAVGAMVPITGPFNVSGQQYHFSLQMAQDEINAKGGVAGKKLKIVFEDVKDSNSIAVNAYLKVVRDINPPLILLSSYTTQNLATEPEVTWRFYQSGPKVVMPQSVHDDAPREWVRGRCHPVREGFPPVAISRLRCAEFR